TMSGADPFSVAASPATNTVYVGNASGFAGLPRTISMINDTACNTLVSSGCRPNPPTITMKFLAYGLAVNQAYTFKVKAPTPPAPDPPPPPPTPSAPKQPRRARARGP